MKILTYYMDDKYNIIDEEGYNDAYKMIIEDFRNDGYYKDLPEASSHRNFDTAQELAKDC